MDFKNPRMEKAIVTCKTGQTFISITCKKKKTYKTLEKDTKSRKKGRKT